MEFNCIKLGQYRYDFDQLENAQIDVPITDEFRITAADYNHDFHNLETPTTSGKIYTIRKKSEKNSFGSESRIISFII